MSGGGLGDILVGEHSMGRAWRLGMRPLSGAQHGKVTGRRPERKAGALSLRAWHAALWNWLCPECSGSPSALSRVARSYLHFRKMTDN